MDEDEREKQFIAVAQAIAMKALEVPLDQRQAFIEAKISEAKISSTRKGYEEKHGPDPKTAEQARKLLDLTRTMVRILEQSGGTIGHA